MLIKYLQKFGIDQVFLTYAAWLIALLGSLISLSLSEIFHLVPCTLCWYQRIALYPVPFIMAVGILRKEEKLLPHYVLPLTIVGTTIALYHSLLQWGIIPEAVKLCVSGISCTTVHFKFLGFITIPFLSFITFGAITLLLFLMLQMEKTDDKRK